MDVRMGKIFIYIGLVLLPLKSIGCICFHRYYLHSIFYSERNHMTCESIGEGPSRRVFLKSENHVNGHQESHFGEVASYSKQCLLLVDNQVIYEHYNTIEEKLSCDREILKVCDKLIYPQHSLMYGAYE